MSDGYLRIRSFQSDAVLVKQDKGVVSVDLLSKAGANESSDVPIRDKPTTRPDWMIDADRAILGRNHADKTKKAVRRQSVPKPRGSRARVLPATRDGESGGLEPAAGKPE